MKRNRAVRVRTDLSYAILFEGKHSNDGEKTQDTALCIFEHFSISGVWFTAIIDLVSGKIPFRRMDNINGP